MKKLIMMYIIVGMVCAGHSGAAVILDFSELPNQPVNGLNAVGVIFHFSIGGNPSSDAEYHSIGPGITTFLDDPSLEGNAQGVLTLEFMSEPTNELQFGLALSTDAPLTPGFTVELFDTSFTSFGVTPVNTFPIDVWTEAQYTYSGTPIRQVVIDFDESSAERFAMDNLMFNPGPLNIVPSPGAILLGSMGITLVSWLRRKRTL